MWIWSGVVALGLFPRAVSYELLEATGVTSTLAPLLLFGAAGLDIVLGVSSLLMRRRFLWVVQMLIIGVYTVIISVKLPEFWLHPYGPIVKNLPMLAALYTLYWLGRR